MSVGRTWDFISSPQNLKTITPERMDIRIEKEVENSGMYAGQIIEYTIRPVLNISMRWVTEITHIAPRYYFVDEQRFGPYKFWHHKHFLEERENGILMTDLVHYALPLGFMGIMMNSLLVRKKLEEIFDYRQKKLEELFGLPVV